MLFLYHFSSNAIKSFLPNFVYSLFFSCVYCLLMLCLALVLMASISIGYHLGLSFVYCVGIKCRHPQHPYSPSPHSAIGLPPPSSSVSSNFMLVLCRSVHYPGIPCRPLVTTRSRDHVVTSPIKSSLLVTSKLLQNSFQSKNFAFMTTNAKAQVI